MKRTIRLDANSYRLTNSGAVEKFYATPTEYMMDYDTDDFVTEFEKCESWTWHETEYAVGMLAVLVSITDVSPNAIRNGRSKPRFYLSFDIDGVAGNLDPSIKSTSGWRGTTRDMSVNAHGIVTIRRIRKLKNGAIAVTVN